MIDKIVIYQGIYESTSYFFLFPVLYEMTREVRNLEALKNITYERVTEEPAHIILENKSLLMLATNDVSIRPRIESVFRARGTWGGWGSDYARAGIRLEAFLGWVCLDEEKTDPDINPWDI